MKKVLAAAALAATMLAGSALPSAAATFTGNGLSSSYTTFAFTVPSAGETVAGSISKSVKSLTITAFDILKGAVVVATGTLSSFGQFQFGGVGPTVLTAGSYSLGVKGSGTGEFDGTLTVSSVPLPTSVALFGMAIVGLGVAGAMRKKSTAAVASV
jgi:hypothetical protein